MDYSYSHRSTDLKQSYSGSIIEYVNCFGNDSNAFSISPVDCCVSYVIECPADWCFFIFIDETRMTMSTTMSFVGLVGPTTHRILHHSSPVGCYVFTGCIWGLQEVKTTFDHGRFGRDHGYTGAEFTCKPWHIFSLTLSLMMPINNHVNWVISNRTIIRQCNTTYIMVTMSFIIVKLEIAFTLKPEEIAADLRQLLAVERFSDLLVDIGYRPEVGGTLQWGRRRRYSLCLHRRNGLFEFTGSFSCAYPSKCREPSLQMPDP